MTVRIIPWLLALAVCAHPSCKTRSLPNSLDSTTGLPETVTLTPPDNPEACERIESSCAPDAMATPPAPTLCRARRYSDMRFVDSHALKGWGPSLCQAQFHLLRRACLGGYDVDRIDRSTMDCSPDPTAGECPPPAAMCITHNDPSTCHLHSYGGVELDEDSEVRQGFHGSNACEATQRIREWLCELELRPSLVDEKSIACTPADTSAADECQNRPMLCPDVFEPQRCYVISYNDADLDTPIEHSGRNACEARAAIHRTACLRGWLPSKLGPVACRD